MPPSRTLCILSPSLSLDWLTVMWQQHSKEFKEDVSSIWDFKESTQQYQAKGGTSQQSVINQIHDLRKWMKEKSLLWSISTPLQWQERVSEKHFQQKKKEPMSSFSQRLSWKLPSKWPEDVKTTIDTKRSMTSLCVIEENVSLTSSWNPCLIPLFVLKLQ